MGLSQRNQRSESSRQGIPKPSFSAVVVVVMVVVVVRLA